MIEFLRRLWRREDRALTLRDVLSSGTSSFVDTEETALKVAAVQACVSLIASDLASCKLILYLRRADGSRQRATSNPLYRLVTVAPNPLVDSYTWTETIVVHLLLWGNSYSELELDGDGRVTGIWTLPPWRVEPVLRDRTLLYRVSLPNGGQAELPQFRVLHIRGLSLDGFVGVPPLRMALRPAVAIARNADRFAEAYFAGDGLGRIALVHPGRLSDEARKNLKASWSAQYGGLQAAHRVALLEEGLKVERIGLPPQEAQMLETRQFQLRDIARIFRVPPSMIGDLERGAAYASVEQQAIDYVTHTIRPWAARIERAMDVQLLLERERQSHYLEFLLDSLLRGDTLSRYRAYAVGRQWGWLSANDIRVRENMDPIPGGDAYLTPLNMQEAQETGDNAGDSSPQN